MNAGASTSPAPNRRRGQGRATATAAAPGELAGRGDTEALLDLGHDPVRGVEELLLDGRPAADLVDREEHLRPREVELARDARDDRAVAVAAPQRLAGGRAQELDERLG